MSRTGAWVALFFCWGAIGCATGGFSSGRSGEDPAALAPRLDSLLARSKTIPESELARELEAIRVSPGFAQLSAAKRHAALEAAARGASERKEQRKAHAFIEAAIETGEATWSDWHLRLLTREEGDWPGAARSLEAMARGWPERFSSFNADFVLYTLYKLRRQRAERASLWSLFETLWDTGWRPKSGTFGTIWVDRVLFMLEKGDLEGAVVASENITSLGDLAKMRVDRRFDAVTQRHPERFDIGRAVQRRRKEVMKRMIDHPRSLQAQLVLLLFLMQVGDYEGIVGKSASILEGIQAARGDEDLYDDQADNLNWIMNYRAWAISALGRWDESLSLLDEASRISEYDTLNVSQVINLATLYSHLGRLEDAKKTLAQVGQNQTPYGRKQVEGVLLSIAIQEEDEVAIKRVLSALAAHPPEAAKTYQDALVEADRLEEAARFLVSRLRDPDLRIEALVQVQSDRKRPQPDYVERMRDRWRQVIERPEVRAVIEEVGRIETFELELK